jgi:hypothetical protein
MNLYVVTGLPNLRAASRVEPTLKLAHETAKATSGDARYEVRIELFDMPTDKLSVVSMLNNTLDDFVAGLLPLQTWRISPRGALVEITEE